MDIIRKKWNVHSELIQKLIDSGELKYMSPEIVDGFIIWMFKCYLGEPGRYGAGYARSVFFSNTGAPLCHKIIKNNSEIIKTRFQRNEEISREIQRNICSQDIQRRYDELMDVIDI